MTTCSTCEDYEFVPGPDGMLERCPDCYEAHRARCPVHGRRTSNGKCRTCGREASLAIDLMARASAAAAAVGL